MKSLVLAVLVSIFGFISMANACDMSKATAATASCCVKNGKAMPAAMNGCANKAAASQCPHSASMTATTGQNPHIVLAGMQQVKGKSCASSGQCGGMCAGTTIALSILVFAGLVFGVNKFRS